MSDLVQDVKTTYYPLLTIASLLDTVGTLNFILEGT